MRGPAADLLTLVQRAGRTAGAFRVGADEVSFAALADRVGAVAHGLCAAGLQRGDRVAILLPRGIDEAVVLLAAAAAGALAVPIHARLKDDQIRHVLQDAAPFAVVTSALRLLALQDPVVVLGSQRAFVVGPDQGVPVASAPLPTAAGPALPAPGGSDPAVLLYTSGSTGRAKGIVQTHHNLALGAAVVAGYLGLGADDHLLALLPFSFDYGLNQLLSALHVGCRITAADHLGLGELATLLQQHRPTGLAGVPSLWHEVATGLATGVLTPADGSSLRYVTNSGGMLRPTDSAVLRRHWPGVAVFAMYGLTEAFRSAFLPPHEFDAHPDSFGRALPGVELLLVAPESGAVLHGPATGELVHAGALVAAGYWRRPEATQARFRPDPRGCAGTVVYSGDLVRRDDAGRHYFVGRVDRLLKVQGHRVSPDEVALAVAGQPGVGEVCVFGIEGGSDGHHIVLCCSGDPAEPGLRERLLRRCRARLPSYMQPARILVLPALPHNGNGKVDEAVLRGMVS
jgi:acyl-CoA synthetase (AMP-forming)/AMP-acid ligase II